MSIEDLLKIKFVEKHQSGVRYKRRVPHNVKADIGKSWFTKNYPAGTPEIEVVRDVARRTIKHTAMIKEKRNRPLTPQERFSVEFDASIWTESSTEAEIHEMVARSFRQERRANTLNAYDQAFVAAVTNSGVVPQWGPILSVAAKEDTARYGIFAWICWIDRHVCNYPKDRIIFRRYPRQAIPGRGWGTSGHIGYAVA